MATKFVPLTADLIDEGEFLENVNKELEGLQRQLTAFVKEHQLKSVKATAKLTIDISLKVQDPESDAYVVSTSMKTTVPKRPATMSIAIGGQNDDEATLFVRQEGSDKTHPEQGKLFKTHGQSGA